MPPASEPVNRKSSCRGSRQGVAEGAVGTRAVLVDRRPGVADDLGVGGVSRLLFVPTGRSQSISGSSVTSLTSRKFIGRFFILEKALRGPACRFFGNRHQLCWTQRRIADVKRRRAELRRRSSARTAFLSGSPSTHFLGSTREQRSQMLRSNIVCGGDEAFQLPVSMIYTPMRTPMDGRTWRVLCWILWEAQNRRRWPDQDDEPADICVRYSAHEMRRGAGLESENGYAGVREALGNLTRVRFDVEEAECSGGRVLLRAHERPGPHFDVVLARELVNSNWRPLSTYALLNMDHIRNLRQPLDFAIYARACLVARARHPQFAISLSEINSIMGTQHTSWSALQRPFLGACVRVAAEVKGTFLIQGWCGGDFRGLDRLLVRVGAEGEPMKTSFPIRHRARFFRVQPAGWEPFVLARSSDAPSL